MAIEQGSLIIGPAQPRLIASMCKFAINLRRARILSSSFFLPLSRFRLNFKCAWRLEHPYIQNYTHFF